jgi:hypothetical protein
VLRVKNTHYETFLCSTNCARPVSGGKAGLLFEQTGHGAQALYSPFWHLPLHHNGLDDIQDLVCRSAGLWMWIGLRCRYCLLDLCAGRHPGRLKFHLARIITSQMLLSSGAVR